MSKLDYVQAADPVEAHEIPEYKGPYDGQLPHEFEEDLPSHPRHTYDLWPRQKRSCSPARQAVLPPRTVPRYAVY